MPERARSNQGQTDRGRPLTEGRQTEVAKKRTYNLPAFFHKFRNDLVKFFRADAHEASRFWIISIRFVELKRSCEESVPRLPWAHSEDTIHSQQHHQIAKRLQAVYRHTYANEIVSHLMMIKRARVDT